VCAHPADDRVGDHAWIHHVLAALDTRPDIGRCHVPFSIHGFCPFRIMHR
jgi:hypothetical protein